MELKDLRHDPHNARRHAPRNIGMIEQALREVGAARSIVIDEDGVVLAGNATIDAAASAGIDRVRVVDTDGREVVAVRRVGLTAAQKTRLALFDNRAAELAEWDAGALNAIDSELFDGIMDDKDLRALLDAASPEEPHADTGAQLGDLKYQVVIECRSEQHQGELLARFELEGLACRALIL